MPQITIFVDEKKLSNHVDDDESPFRGMPYSSLARSYKLRYLPYTILEDITRVPRSSLIGRTVIILGQRHTQNSNVVDFVLNADWYDSDIKVIIASGLRVDFSKPKNPIGSSDVLIESGMILMPTSTPPTKELDNSIRLAQLLHKTSTLKLGERIVRSILFPPEYYQSGITILGYFGTILREKNLADDVTVAIEQDGLVVRLVIEAPTGQRELIERTLESYALVISGQAAIEDLKISARGVIELRSQLNIALTQLQTTRDLLRYVEEDRSYLRQELSEVKQLRDNSQRRSDLEVDRFMKLIGTLIDKNAGLSEMLHALSEKAISANNREFFEAVKSLKTMIERGLTENDREEFIQKVQIIKNENPSGFEGLKNVVLGSVAEASGSFLYDWIKIIIASLPK